MGFKTIEQYNEDKYRNQFRITENGGTQDVVFLYRSKADVLVCDAHYISAGNKSGYVHCLGAGCPACAKGLRVQSKLFIPLYIPGKETIEFWGMGPSFEHVLDAQVFNKTPNPSEYVFRVTRNGEYKDNNTTYGMQVVGRNSMLPYDQILAKLQTKMPDCYDGIIVGVSAEEMTARLNTNKFEEVTEQEYIPVPRSGYQSSVPDTYVNATEVVGSSDTAIAPVVEDTDGDDLPDPVF